MFKISIFFFILPLRCKPRIVLLLLLAWNTTQYLYDFTISQFPHFFWSTCEICSGSIQAINSSDLSRLFPNKKVSLMAAWH